MATNHCTTYTVLFVGTMGLLLFGCSKATPLPDQMDRSPFTGIPCAAPCWHGLVIGKSNESDVMSTLSTLTFIDRDTIRIHRMLSMTTVDFITDAPGVEITANCINPSKECLELDVVDDTLTEIEIMFNYDITLEEAIDYLGPPDYIGYRNLGAERILCEVDIVWSSRQLVLTSQVFEGYDAVENNCGVVRDTGKIRSSLLISRAWYRSNAAIENMLSIGANEFSEFSGTIPDK